MNMAKAEQAHDERAEFVAWLQAYAGGGEEWRAKVLMGEHDIALALWLDKRREIDRLRSELAGARQSLVLAEFRADNADRAVLADAQRYRWLRARELDSVHEGGVFAGQTPQNVVINGADLDAVIDAAIAGSQPPNV